MAMQLPAQGMVTVRFHYGQGEEGKQPIQASLNGEAILIPRNQPVDLDVKWLRGVFDRAYAQEFEAGDQGRGLRESKRVPRYPYEIVEIPDPKASREGGAPSGATSGKVRA